jgi:hypothetical protein
MLVMTWSTRWFYLIGMKLDFSGKIFEKYSYKISSESVLLEQSCCMRRDRQTDGRNYIVAFRNFANASQIESSDKFHSIVSNKQCLHCHYGYVPYLNAFWSTGLIFMEQSTVWDTTLCICVPNIAVHLFGSSRCKWDDRILLHCIITLYLYCTD